MSYFKLLLFPPKCAACGRLLDWQTPREAREERAALCPECQRLWESETLETCGICAKPVGECRCMPLLMSQAKCQGLCKAVYYTPMRKSAVQNRLIWRIKKKDDTETHLFLAGSLLPAVEEILSQKGIDRSEVILTYLPRSHRATVQTGTDQAQMLAHALGALCGLSVRALIQRRRGSNQPQKHLSPKERIKNAKRAYLANPKGDCRGKTVLLVDDMVTTGASMAVCTRILRRMGAKAVFCVAVATDVMNKDVMPSKKA